MRNDIKSGAIAFEFRRQNSRIDRPRRAPLPSVDSFDATGCNCFDINRSEVEVERLVYNLHGLAEAENGAVEEETT